MGKRHNDPPLEGPFNTHLAPVGAPVGGPALQLLRSTRGRSRSVVAQAAGIAQSMLSSSENDRVLPEVGSQQKVLVALDLRLRDLCRAIEAVQAERAPIAARSQGEGEKASGEVALREIIDRALQLGAKMAWKHWPNR